MLGILANQTLSSRANTADSGSARYSHMPPSTWTPRTLSVVQQLVRPTRQAVQNVVGVEYAGGWSNAKRVGWRAVRVQIIAEAADG